MSDARGPTRRGAAAIAFAVSMACVPTEDLSSYSRESGSTGGRRPTTAGGGAGAAAGGNAGLGSGVPDSSVGGSSGAGELPAEAGAPADGGGAGSSSPPSEPVDAGPGTPDAEVEAGPVEPPPPPPPSCSGGALAPGSQTCYFVASSPRSWHDARQLCQFAGRTLVKIESAEEDGFVASLSAASLWIGASDTAVDGHFVWSDGSPILFSNWGGSQPDAFPGPDCVEKRQEPGEAWYDQPCGNPRLYVCEQPVD